MTGTVLQLGVTSLTEQADNPRGNPLFRGAAHVRSINSSYC